MTPLQNSNVPVPGWIGGFAGSDPAYAYPHPNLSSLEMKCNMANIDLLQRQQGVKWPEFSWETDKGNAGTRRCFQMFAPYISRLGYTDEGRIYSIICPQQGIYFPTIEGTLNVEVTVLGQRGWVDETTKALAADMAVEGKIWFSPDTHQYWLIKQLWEQFESTGRPFPSEKSKAIRVTTHRFEQPDQPIFPVRTGETPRFASPGFARHETEAWAVGNVEVEIGPIANTGDSLVDEFNSLVLDLFNLASGNMLQPGNMLSWNVWFEAPTLVDRVEWKEHADKWRESIDVEHKSPDGEGTPARFFDGSEFHAAENLIEEKIQDLIAFLKKLA